MSFAFWVCYLSEMSRSITTWMFKLMRAVERREFYIQLLSIKELPAELERCGDQLTRIEKSLGEYLEQERASFPRSVLCLSQHCVDDLVQCESTVYIRVQSDPRIKRPPQLLPSNLIKILGFCMRRCEKYQHNRNHCIEF